MKYIFLLFAAMFFLQCYGAEAQRITVTGSWTLSLTAPTEAGLDYSSSFFESNANQTLISVTSSFILLPSFSINVRMEPTTPVWPSTLILRVRRTGGGTGLAIGGLNGGTTYLTLSNSNQLFFSYGGVLTLSAINNIPIQYRIEGISVLLPVSSYTGTITYTVTN